MGDSAVYVAPDVAAVRDLWGRSGALAGTRIVAQLSAFADALMATQSTGERAAAVLIRNWSQGPLLDDPRAGLLSDADAHSTAARDHGFSSWSIVDGRCDPSFELAVDAIVLGQVDVLRRLIADQPTLVQSRSAYGHRATLLHYVAANGTEIRRQVVPSNAADIASVLLDAGVDASATIEVYGKSLDTLALLRSSAHPRAAGVAKPLEAALTGAT